MRSGISIRRAALVLTLATGVSVAALTATSAIASTGAATIYSDKNSCLAESGSASSGSVTFTREDKGLTVDVAMDSAGQHGVVLFTLTGGSCRSQFLGVTNSNGAGEFSLKIKGSGHPITVVLCVDVSGVPNFSDPVTLP